MANFDVQVWDYQFTTSMAKLLTKNTNEVVIGMFIAGKDLTNRCVSIFKKYMKDHKRSQFLLQLDPSLRDNTLGIKVLESVPTLGTIRKKKAPFQATAQSLFCMTEVPHKVKTSEQSKTGLDIVCYGQKNADTLAIFSEKDVKHMKTNEIINLQETSTLFNNIEKMEQNVESVHEMIERCEHYIDGVKEGSIEGDPEIAKMLANALCHLSHLDKTSIEHLLKDHYQDIVMLTSLTHITKS